MINKKRISIITGTGILCLTTLCSCMMGKTKKITDETNSTSNQGDSSHDITSTSSEISITESSDSAIQTSKPASTETTQRVDPLLNLGIDYDTYSDIAYNVISSGRCSSVVGFDNSLATSLLRENVYNYSGIYDETIKLSDVNYFQNVDVIKDLYVGRKFSDNLDYSFNLELVRAALSTLGLRFGIDEIPASYFEERFPAFTYGSLYLGSAYNVMKDGSFNVEDGNKYNELADPTMVDDSFWMDMFLYEACRSYNKCLDSYVFHSPYGIENNIRIERDEETGKNVLAPNEKQKQQLLDDIHALRGCENIDINAVQTKEEFISIYGIDPEELFSPSKAYYLNTKEGFEQYLQENGLEAPKTVTVSYEDVNFSFDLPPSRGKSS